jgi:hypothetical protein
MSWLPSVEEVDPGLLEQTTAGQRQQIEHKPLR